jgi:hypothetical protein
MRRFLHRARASVLTASLAACAELGTSDAPADASAAGDAQARASGAGLDLVAPEQVDAFVWPQTRAPADGDAGPRAALDASSSACDGSTPHGCYQAALDNPKGCPPQIHEQSSGYPPLDEWTGCEAPWYVPCVYRRPDGSDASCVCDLSFHWICAY